MADRARSEDAACERALFALAVETSPQRARGARSDERLHLFFRQEIISPTVERVDDRAPEREHTGRRSEKARVTRRSLAGKRPRVLVVDEAADHSAAPGDELGRGHVRREAGVTRADSLRRTDRRADRRQHLALEHGVERGPARARNGFSPQEITEVAVEGIEPRDR